MNKTHRIVWSESRQTWIVAHEKAAFGGRPGTTLAASVVSHKCLYIYADACC